MSTDSFSYHFVNLISNPVSGGAKMVVENLNSKKSGQFLFSLIIIFIILLLIRAWIVQVCYNTLAPKVIGQWKGQTSQEVKSSFKGLGFWDSLLLVIFISILFAR